MQVGPCAYGHTTLASVGLEVASSKGHNKNSIKKKKKLWPPPTHLGLLVTVEKKRAIILAGVIDPEYHKEVTLLLQNGKEI